MQHSTEGCGAKKGGKPRCVSRRPSSTNKGPARFASDVITAAARRVRGRSCGACRRGCGNVAYRRTASARCCGGTIAAGQRPCNSSPFGGGASGGRRGGGKPGRNAGSASKADAAAGDIPQACRHSVRACSEHPGSGRGVPGLSAHGRGRRGGDGSHQPACASGASRCSCRGGGQPHAIRQLPAKFISGGISGSAAAAGSSTASSGGSQVCR